MSCPIGFDGESVLIVIRHHKESKIAQNVVYNMENYERHTFFFVASHFSGNSSNCL